MSTNELANFLQEQCRQRGISLRSLSLKSGLSSGTVHSIIQRKYQPTLFSLNRLADFLGVRREYLWQLAGLLEDVDYDATTTFGDPQLRFQLTRVDRMPKAARNLVIGLIEAVIIFLNTGGTE